MEETDKLKTESKISNCVYYETPLLEQINELQQELDKIKEENQRLIALLNIKIDNSNYKPIIGIDDISEKLIDILCKNYAKDVVIELDKYKAKEKELREYITSYESISTIQGLDDIAKNKNLDEKTMIEMVNRYLEVHDKLLDILDKE